MSVDPRRPADLLQKDPKFSRFVARMKLTQRSFYVASKTPGAIQKVSSNFFDTDEEAKEEAERTFAEKKSINLSVQEYVAQEVKINADQRAAWTDLVTREYIRRKQLFVEWNYKKMFFVVAACLLALCVMWWFWPLWHKLVNIDVDDYFATLGLEESATQAEVKRAYRQLVKQWHPDLNPDCGIACRDMMMKIQKAHDVLLAKGSGPERMELEMKREQAFADLRVLIVSRSYSIAGNCIEFYSTLLAAVLASIFSSSVKESKDSTAILVLRGIISVAFLLSLGTYIIGPNVIVLIQCFFFVVNLFKQSQTEQMLAGVVKRANFDIIRDFFIFVLPATLYFIWYFFYVERYPQIMFFSYQLFIGIAYLSAHLAKFAPNLFDNFALLKCSISLQHCSWQTTEGMSHPTVDFSLNSFIWAEVMFLVDDIFAFTAHIPNCFRIVVFVSHILYLAQMQLFPWDLPAIGRRKRKLQALQESSEKRQKVAQDKTIPEKDGDGDSLPPPSELTAREKKFILGLDDEVCFPGDILVARYPQFTLPTPPSPSQPKKSVETFDKFFCNEDVTQVILATVTIRQGAVPVIAEKLRTADAEGAEILCRDGKAQSVFRFSNQASKAAQILRESMSYASALRRQATEVGCKKAVELLSATSISEFLGSVCVMALALVVLFASAAHVLPRKGSLTSPKVSRHIAHYDKLFSADRLVTPNRFVEVFDVSHTLNSPHAGGLFFSVPSVNHTFAVSTPDTYDTLRMLLRSVGNLEENEIGKKSKGGPGKHSADEKPSATKQKRKRPNLHKRTGFE